jgi:hypothetical protein
MVNPDEIDEVDDVLYRAFSQGNLDAFFQLEDVNIMGFDTLYSAVSDILEVRTCGRSRTIRRRDS